MVKRRMEREGEEEERGEVGREATDMEKSISKERERWLELLII